MKGLAAVGYPLSIAFIGEIFQARKLRSPARLPRRCDRQNRSKGKSFRIASDNKRQFLRFESSFFVETTPKRIKEKYFVTIMISFLYLFIICAIHNQIFVENIDKLIGGSSQCRIVRRTKHNFLRRRRRLFPIVRLNILISDCGPSEWKREEKRQEEGGEMKNRFEFE